MNEWKHLSYCLSLVHSRASCVENNCEKDDVTSYNHIEKKVNALCDMLEGECILSI